MEVHFRSVFALRFRLEHGFGLLAPVSVRDLIARHLEQPRGHTFDRFQSPIRVDQLPKDVLQNVLGVVVVAHPFPDEVEESAAFLPDCPFNLGILLFGHRVTDYRVHLTCSRSGRENISRKVTFWGNKRKLSLVTRGRA